MKFADLDRSELARLMLVNLTEDEMVEVMIRHVSEATLEAMVHDSSLGQVRSEGGQQHLVNDLDTRTRQRLEAGQQGRAYRHREQLSRVAEAFGLDD